MVRDRSEVARLHGSDGELEAVTLRDGERVPLSFMFLVLGATRARAGSATRSGTTSMDLGRPAPESRAAGSSLVQRVRDVEDAYARPRANPQFRSSTHKYSTEAYWTALTTRLTFKAGHSPYGRSESGGNVA